MRSAVATTASAGAQRAKAEAIQFPCVALDCFARARNGAEGLAENSQRHCEELLRRRNPVLFRCSWIASQELAMTLRGLRVNRVRWLPGLSTSLRGALATKQSSLHPRRWIASRSLSSGAQSRDPVARKGVEGLA
jgi:hypothetical protein